MADDADARAGLLADGEEPGAQARDQVLRVLNVELDAREVRFIADAVQPVVEHAQRPVAGEEAGNEEHRPAVAAANAPAPHHGVAQQGGHLAEGERIPKPHSLGW